MRQSTQWLVLGIGILGTALLSGCTAPYHRSCSCARIGTPVAGQIIVGTPGSTTVEPPLSPTTAPTPALPPPVATHAEEPVQLYHVAKTETPTTTESNTAPNWHASTAPVEHERTTAAEAPVTAYSRAVDFSWLRGVLERGRQPNIWLLRYAPADDNDRFGGCVTLVLDADDARTLQAGQTVRVEGALMDPDAGGSRPGYRVTTIKLSE